jgi:hypothetical protein
MAGLRTTGDRVQQRTDGDSADDATITSGSGERTEDFLEALSRLRQAYDGQACQQSALIFRASLWRRRTRLRAVFL